jgi:integrase
VPFLYSPDQVVALMPASRQLHPPLRAATMETIVDLLAVSELRVGEVIRLTNSDVGFEQGSLVVRDSKSGKSRAVPLHSSTLKALRSYTAVRARFFRGPAATASSSPRWASHCAAAICVTPSPRWPLRRACRLASQDRGPRPRRPR